MALLGLVDELVGVAVRAASQLIISPAMRSGYEA